MSLSGGLLIGLAATLFLLFNGRIAGISNLVAGLFTTDRQALYWRLAFLAGLLGGGALLWAVRPELIGTPPANRSLGELALAGLLVGLGACISNGCTSGHGVCGLGRRSLRSLVATLTFMVTGILTVTLLKHFGS